jgi:molybdenum cofactor synthesis domain-containing protein
MIKFSGLKLTPQFTISAGGARNARPISFDTMIPIDQAIRLVEANTQYLGDEDVDLASAAGRILAEDIAADVDLPPFDRSQMDGFAVRAAETAGAPVDLVIAGESAAGRRWPTPLSPGGAVRIMTGAPVPAGADAVQKVELTRESDGSVRILETLKPGTNIVIRGAEVRAGTTIFSRGELVTGHMIAPLAAFGKAILKLGKRPRTAVLSTGSELVAVAVKPGEDQIRNSNAPILASLISKCSGPAEILASIGDDLNELVSVIGEATSRNDLLVVTGGVSVGKYDLTKEALRQLRAEIFFEKLRLKPGKPAVFARLGECLVFALPGNPVSAAVTFYLLVRFALMRMQGANQPRLREETARLGGPAKAPKERDAFVAATLRTDGEGQLIADPLPTQGSSDLVSFSRAEALISVERGTGLAEGEAARILLLR